MRVAANGRPTARSDSEHGGLFADRTRIGPRSPFPNPLDTPEEPVLY